MVEPRKLCETFPAPSPRIPDSPCLPRAGSFAQMLVDFVLNDTSSSPLQLPQRLATDMPTAPHPATQLARRSVCKLHSERHPPAGSLLVKQLHWALHDEPSQARL